MLYGRCPSFSRCYSTGYTEYYYGVLYLDDLKVGFLGVNVCLEVGGLCLLFLRIAMRVKQHTVAFDHVVTIWPV